MSEALVPLIAPLMPHLVVAPVLVPLVAAALLLLIGQERREVLVAGSLVATFATLAVAVLLLVWVDAQGATPVVAVYLPANWDVPFGIVLATDRLSAMMLVVTGLVAMGALVFAAARWQRAGVYFHPLFQIGLMGINGAYLTADLFNLFVFVEVMLTASYALLLHGSGRARVQAGLHYIAVNLVASALFLLGVAMIYGIAGTLGMADVAQKLAALPPHDRGLLYAGAALLGIALLAKAAIWPLNFWLVPAYVSAAAPVAALFVLLTKVGFYAILRLWTLFLAPQGDATARFGADVLVIGGLATIVVASLAMVVSRNVRRLAALATMVSSGTLVAVLGLGDAVAVGGALYYLVASSLAVAVVFLLADLVERSREKGTGATLDEGLAEPMPFAADGRPPAPGVNLDDEEAALIGQPVPVALAFLGASFLACVALLAGLPPLAGFVAKFAMLDTIIGSAAPAQVPLLGWAVAVVLVGSSFVALGVLARTGIRYFWAPQGRPPPRLAVIECLPIAALLAILLAMTLAAGPALRYTTAAAEGLFDASAYVQAIAGTRPVPSPTHGTRGRQEAPR